MADQPQIIVPPAEQIVFTQPKPFHTTPISLPSEGRPEIVVEKKDKVDESNFWVVLKDDLSKTGFDCIKKQAYKKNGIANPILFEGTLIDCREYINSTKI